VSDSRNKFEESEYFFERMKDNIDNRKFFTFNLSAFLSSARSVMSIMQREFSQTMWFKGWYKDKQDRMDTDFKFFNCMRVATIHKKPVIPAKKVFVNIKESLHIAESVKVITNDTVVNQYSSSSTEAKTEDQVTKSADKAKIETMWFFQEKPSADLFQLCNTHLDELRKLVDKCEELSRVK
jgi:hypothetical protein